MHSLAAVRSLVSPPAHEQSLAGPPLDLLMLFGFLAAIFTLLLWFYRGQSRPALAAMAICLAAMAAYTFLQGAWPMGIVAAAWSVNAMLQCCRAKSPGTHNRIGTQGSESNPRLHHWNSESRIGRLFHMN
jgi:hypothetical protein